MKKKKSIWKYISYGFSCIFMVLTLYIIVSAAINISNNKPPKVFGNSFFVVQTESMEPDIKVGDFVVSRDVSFHSIKVGDVISFTCIEQGSIAYGQTITHKVKEVYPDPSNAKKTLSIKTYGINNNSDDKELVTKSNYLGKVVYVNSTIGKLVSKSNVGKSIFFLIIIILMIVVVIIETKNILTNSKKAKEEKMLEEKAKMKQQLLEEIESKDDNV